MKHLYLGTALALAWAVPAAAQVPPPGTDPTNLHITSPNAGSTQDPVLLGDSNTFSVLNVSNGQAKNVANMKVIVAVPQFSNMTSPGTPVIGSLMDSNSAETATTTGPFDFTATNQAGAKFLAPGGSTPTDLNSYVGCGSGCDKSINSSNVLAAETALFGAPEVNNDFLGFEVFEVPITYNPNNFLAPGDSLTLGELGAGLTPDQLAEGTLIAAIGNEAGNPGTPFVTSWTNTGDVNTVDVVSTPEPGSLGLLATALLGLGGLAYRRRRK